MKPRATAVGGPGHGRAFPVGRHTILNVAPMREPALSTWDWKLEPATDAIVPETYELRRYRHSGFLMTVRLWVHVSLWGPDGATVPERLLPEILRTRAYEVCER